MKQNHQSMRDARLSATSPNSAVDENELKEQHILDEVNDYLEHQQDEDPLFYDKLISIYESRKWIFRSFYLYSPAIFSPGDSKLKFKCFNKELADNPPDDAVYPLYPIQSAFFFKILDMAGDFTFDEKEKIEELAAKCDSFRVDPKYYQYFLYNKFMHYICISILRPPKTESEIEEERRKEEIEARLLAEQNAEPSDAGMEEQVVEEEEEPTDLTPVNQFTSNFYIGNIHKEALQHEFELYRKLLWRNTRDNLDLIKLYSLHFYHTTDKYDYIKFVYLVKANESETWE